MKLTEKCLNDYNTWIYTNHPDNLISENCGYGYGMFERDLEQLLLIIPEPCQNALIIEFLDSVQYKGNPLFELCFEIFWKIKTDGQSFNDVCIQSIEKANEIYNKN